MFLFLRRVRRALLEEGAFRRYLGYALGEILLVVAGILIALQIDGWNDQRLDRAQEREYLASMLNDLRVDARLIDEAVAGNRVLLEGLDGLLRLLSLPPEQLQADEASLRSAFMHALVYTYWYLRADFSELTIAQLKSSGGLLLIEDREVRDAILTYQQGLEACRYQYEEMKSYFHTIEGTQKELFNLRLAKRTYEYLEEDFLRMLEPLENYGALVPVGTYLADSDPLLLNRYYGDALMYKTALIEERYGLR